MTNPLEGQPRRFIGIARVPIIRRAAEYYQGFVTPWRLHPFHHEIADKNGFEKFLMQPNSTEGLKNRLLESTSFTEKERARVKKALNLATVIHAGQMREDKVKTREAGFFNEAEYAKDGNTIYGTIKNSATMAKFKDIVLTVTFYSQTQTAIESKDFTIYEFYKPNTATLFELKVYPPEAMAQFGVEVKTATAAD